METGSSSIFLAWKKGSNFLQLYEKSKADGSTFLITYPWVFKKLLYYIFKKIHKDYDF